MVSRNIFVFTDIDLDGATSLLTLLWAEGLTPAFCNFKTVTVTNLRKEFLIWAETDSINNYDAVYFLDLDTSGVADLIDSERVIIIDHHVTHFDAKGIYKHANVFITVTTSCAKLIHHVYKDKLYSGIKPLADSQKMLIRLADDYDCYALTLEDTYPLNCLFTNTQKSYDKTRTHLFIERFYNGFNGFTPQEKNLVKEYTDNRDRAIANLEVFGGNVKIGKSECKVVGTTGSKYVNEICDYLITAYGADIVFMFNTNSSHISFRKNKTCPIDLSKLAAKLCGGGGHEYAAGGKPTDDFMAFTTQLTPICK